MHKLTVRIPEAMHRALDKEARARNTSIASLIRVFVAEKIPVPGMNWVVRGVTLPSDLVVRLWKWHKSGQKIQAVKDIRWATSVGLKEAKGIADHLWPAFDANAYAAEWRTLSELQPE